MILGSGPKIDWAIFLRFLNTTPFYIKTRHGSTTSRSMLEQENDTQFFFSYLFSVLVSLSPGNGAYHLRKLIIRSFGRWSWIQLTMGSTFRDRTAEFHSLSQTLKKIGAAIPSVHQAESDPTSSKRSSPPGSSRSEFNKKASQIGLRIHETSQKTARLSKCTFQTFSIRFIFAFFVIRIVELGFRMFGF